MEKWRRYLLLDAELPCMNTLRRPLVEEVSQCDVFQGQCLEKQTVFVLPIYDTH